MFQIPSMLTFPLLVSIQCSIELKTVKFAKFECNFLGSEINCILLLRLFGPEGEGFSAPACKIKRI